MSNGDLLDRAETAGYDVLITTDQNMRYQQNLSDRGVGIVVLMDSRVALRPLPVPPCSAGRPVKRARDASAHAASVC